MKGSSHSCLDHSGPGTLARLGIGTFGGTESPSRGTEIENLARARCVNHIEVHKKQIQR